MLPKDRRIQKSEFLQVIQFGKRINSSHFTLYIFKKNSIGEKSNFSFSVSKKVAKDAVERNKIRRRGYSIIEKKIIDMPNDYSFIFVCKKGSNNQKFSAMEKEITDLLTDFFV